MKVTNLTDVATKALTQGKLVNQTIAVGDKMLSPGASDEVDEATLTRVRSSLQDMVSRGLLAIGEPPADYMVAKSKLGASPAPARLPPVRGPGVAAAAELAAASPPTTGDDEPSARASRSSRGGR